MSGKTRPFAGPSDWKCPCHKILVTSKRRMSIDLDDGKLKYTGDYYACPRYAECGYYVSPGDGNRAPVVKMIDVDERN